MEQRLRLVQGGHQPLSDKRTSERRPIAVPGQIVWKDARGNTRLTEVVTRDVSEHGVSVECLNGAWVRSGERVYFCETGKCSGAAAHGRYYVQFGGAWTRP